MATDLHDRLVAAVSARRELADQAEAEITAAGQTWAGYVDSIWKRTVFDADKICDHFTANDPSQILRDTAAHLEILRQFKRWQDNVDEAEREHLWDTADEEASDRAYLEAFKDVLKVLATIYPEVTQ